MGLEPALHPDMATFGFPDFGKFEGAATTGTLKRIVAATLFDALAPFKMLKGHVQCFQVEKRELETESFEGSASQLCKLAFDIAGVETGVAHDLHTLWGNMRDEVRNEVKGGAGDGDTLTGVGVDVSIGDLLAVVTDQV